ncbi:hypothetical protein MNBD_NITROSPIRAE02-1274 [hydrothermal vent metagenome]|uniref:4-vinyl reductase 4VR domain-containing protein n=1 Tax=hydrothermal vent metagenome TaxID=652676 RepID=A0A3B1CZZ9_9ZZZZ
MDIKKVRLEDISKTKRPTLGDEVPVEVFRLLRIIGMYSILGEGSGYTLYLAGKELGIELDVNTTDELATLLKKLKIGILTFIESSDNKVVVRLDECITCSGLPDIGKMICHFEGGIIAGALERVLKRPAKGVQTKSHTSGFDHCEFQIHLL